MTIITRITQVVVLPEGEPLPSKQATVIEIVDEAAGEFVEVRQHHGEQGGGIRIDPAEWPAISEAISTMIGECRG